MEDTSFKHGLKWVINDESEVSDCNEVMCVQDKVSQEESEQDGVDAVTEWRKLIRQMGDVFAPLIRPILDYAARYKFHICICMKRAVVNL